MKKKNKTPVVLSNQELMPSVLGTVDDKGKSIFPMILLFGILIGFIVGLPTITGYIKGEQQISFGSGNNTEIGNEDSDKPNINPTDDDMTFYDYKSGLEIAIDGIVFSNFEIDSGILSVTITNQNAVNTYLSTHLLYLELYDSNLTLLQRVKMPSVSLNKGLSDVYEFDLSVSGMNISKLILEEKQPETYPAVNLKKESDGTYSLTCSKDAEKLEYLFDTESKLYYITHTVNYSSSALNYQELLIDYQQISSKYNGVDGVISNISNTTYGFTVTSTFALEKIDFSNRTIKSTLNHEAYYGKDTEGKVVYFELSAMNYQCS